MNRGINYSKPLRWFMGLLMTALLLAGCGGGGKDSAVAGTVVLSPPTVVSTAPANAATGVAPNGKLIVNFSTTIHDTSIVSPATTFTLKETVSGTSVPGTVSLDGTNKIVTFTPTASLAPNT